MLKLRIVLAGGGSGGHLYPLLAVAHSLRAIAKQNDIQMDMIYIGPSDARFTPLFDNDTIRIKTLFAPKWRRYGSLSNLADIPKFFLSIVQALWKLYWCMPDVVFSKGGPGALSVVLASWFYRIPVVVHESDATPGITNVASSLFAKRVAVGFELALQYFTAGKRVLTGNPIRANLLKQGCDSARAKRELGFDPESPLLLVLGGSLGSERINEFLLLSLHGIVGSMQVLHQTGPANFLKTKKMAQAVLIDVPLSKELATRYQAVAYFDANYGVALSAADIVVSRAGASTIFEIAAFGKPAIIIPLQESANDHQRANAYEYAKTGAAIVIEESNLMPGIFLNQLNALLADTAKLEKMKGAAKGFYKPDAADKIAVEVVQASP